MSQVAKKNKIRADKGSEFYNRSMKSCLQDNDTEMYSKKIVYLNNLYDIVNKYNNIYHRTIKMKNVDVKSNTHLISIKRIKKILNIKLVIM